MGFPPEWHALGREAELAAEQLATGVTLLGKANHAQNGLYNQAFFSLSIGIERLAKLVLIADYAIENSGEWMTDDQLRLVGHDISKLIIACEPIAQKFAEKKWSARPSLQIHAAMINCLTNFATLSRYYNLASLTGGRAAQRPEPIAAWWTDVGELILSLHYTESQKNRDLEIAVSMGELTGEFVHVLHHDEQQKAISDIKGLMLREGATKIVQKYGRLYVMQIIRWLSTTLSQLSHKGAYTNGIDALLGLNEPFVIFYNEDSYFLGRKTWSIYKL